MMKRGGKSDEPAEPGRGEAAKVEIESNARVNNNYHKINRFRFAWALLAQEAPWRNWSIRLASHIRFIRTDKFILFHLIINCL